MVIGLEFFLRNFFWNQDFICLIDGMKGFVLVIGDIFESEINRVNIWRVCQKEISGMEMYKVGKGDRNVGVGINLNGEGREV